jgi:Secretion system C-terminal sorting domain
LDHTDDYSYTDPEQLSPSAFYRILVKDVSGKSVSKIVLLTTSDIQYDIISAINPFREKISFELTSPSNTVGTVSITDQHGKTLKQIKYSFSKGVNQVSINDVDALPAGSYILQVITPNGVKSKKLVKVQY